MAASDTATTCSPRASSVWRRPPAGVCGITSWCATDSGTTTSRRLRTWSTSRCAGAAFVPDTGRLFVPSITAPNVVTLSPPPADWIKDRYVGRLQGLRGPQGLPLFKPPFGRLTAIDLAGGDHVWMVPIGEGPRHHPRLEPLQLGRLGWDRRSFPLATRPLLFVAQTGPAGGTQPGGEGPGLAGVDKAG